MNTNVQFLNSGDQKENSLTELDDGTSKMLVNVNC